MPPENLKHRQCRHCGMPGEITSTMLRHAVAIAHEQDAQALLICGGKFTEVELLPLPADMKTIIVVSGDSNASMAEGAAQVIRVPHMPPTRTSQIRLGVLLAVSRDLLEPNDTVVCVSGLSESGVLDTITAIRVGDEFSMFLGPNRAHWETSDIRPDVLQKVIELAAELAVEGREGNPVGAFFVLGDIPNVLPKTHQMVLNPFQGYPPEQRNILDTSRLGETIKEFSTIDGAFLIHGDGTIVSVGTHIDSSLVFGQQQLPQGLGARHRAAAAITAVTSSIAIALSQSTGNVTIYRKGHVVAEIPRSGKQMPERPRTSLWSGSDSERVVIVGGGIGGLSIALRLAETGLPATVLEAGRIGSGATTRNQGWLWSGALIAPRQRGLAQMFHAALEQTLAFCPTCVEPQSARMLYLFTEPESRIRDWTAAWHAAGIPYEPVATDDVVSELPLIDSRRIHAAFRLPDRSIRVDALLNQLAVAARAAGVEIQTETSVAELIREQDRVRGVLTAQGEEISAQMVILATGAAEHALIPGSTQTTAAPAESPKFISLKSHLLAVQPGIGRTPFCLADRGGVNHLPHGGLSIFGSNRWIPAAAPSDDAVVREHIESIWKTLESIMPDIGRENHQATEWAATTVEKPPHSNEPSSAILPPTVIEHSPLKNVFSALMGRATLWPILAERTRQAVLEKLDATPIAASPWAELSRPEVR